MSLASLPPHPQLPASLHVAAEASGFDEDDAATTTSSGSVSHLYTHQGHLRSMLASPIVPDVVPSATDNQDHDDSSRMTLAPHSCMSLRASPRATALAPTTTHNPYSCSPSFLEVPLEVDEGCARPGGVLPAATATTNAAGEMNAGVRTFMTLPQPEYGMQVNSNNVSSASAVRVHVKHRPPRRASTSTLMHTASPSNLSLDPSQLCTPDTAPLSSPPPQSYSPSLHQSFAQPSAPSTLRVPSRGLVRQHTPYAESLIPREYEVGHKDVFSEAGEANRSEEGTEENFLTPRDLAFDQHTDVSCVPSPSAVPLSPESILLVTGGAADAHRRASTAAALTHAADEVTPAAGSRPAVLSSAASDAPTFMSVASHTKRRRRHGRKGHGHDKEDRPVLGDLPPAMDLMFLPPPPPPLQHLTALGLPLNGTYGGNADGDWTAEAYDRYRAVVQRWYDRITQSEHSYLVSVYGGTGEVSRPCPRREQFIRDSGISACGAEPVSVTALVAWVASMDQWWTECVQPFTFLRRHQALPPAITAAALAAASHSGSGSSTAQAVGRVGSGSNFRPTPLAIHSGASSALPSSPIQWMSPRSPQTSAFANATGSPAVSPATGARSSIGGAGETAYATFGSAPFYYYGHNSHNNNAGGVPPRCVWNYPSVPPPPPPQQQQQPFASCSPSPVQRHDRHYTAHQASGSHWHGGNGTPAYAHHSVLY